MDAYSNIATATEETELLLWPTQQPDTAYTRRTERHADTDDSVQSLFVTHRCTQSPGTHTHTSTGEWSVSAEWAILPSYSSHSSQLPHCVVQLWDGGCHRGISSLCCSVIHIHPFRSHHAMGHNILAVTELRSDSSDLISRNGDLEQIHILPVCSLPLYMINRSNRANILYLENIC